MFKQDPSKIEWSFQLVLILGDIYEMSKQGNKFVGENSQINVLSYRSTFLSNFNHGLMF